MQRTNAGLRQRAVTTRSLDKQGQRVSNSVESTAKTVSTPNPARAVATFWPAMLPLVSATTYSSLDDFQEQNLGVMVMVWIFGLLMAYGIGANDVANCFATSVGSGSLTLRQAVVCASFCEVFGAVFLSKSVTDTVRKKMIDIKVTKNEEN